MHLLNTHDLRLETFWDERATTYAILSHRWGKEEVSFHDIQNLEVARTKKGFWKILNTCEVARKKGFKYMWIDTCCINKESSAELSEAINSMYQWYEASAVCYVYLSDVDTKDQIPLSLWFTRGWTLQELLAPRNIVFYNQYWEHLGTKQTLSEVLTLSTGIDRAILSNEVPVSSRSIAQRMCWASQRITTRVEDIAYCLLGLLDVAIPLLYGEKGKAFFRLQEEIIKKSTDHSLFAWSMDRKSPSGLLADSPTAFAGCRNVVEYIHKNNFVVLAIPGLRYVEKPYSMTNRGLSIRMLAVQIKHDLYLVRLKCSKAGGHPPNLSYNRCLGMYMKRLNDDVYAPVEHEGETCALRRTVTWEAGSSSLYSSILETHVPQVFRCHSVDYKEDFRGFRFATCVSSHHSRTLEGRRFEVSATQWSPEESIMFVRPGEYGTVHLYDSTQDNEIRLIKLGFDFDGNPLCSIRTSFANDIDQVLWGRSDDQLKQKRTEWIEVVSRVVQPMQPRQSSWDLKGDRNFGMNISIVSLCEIMINRGRELNSEQWYWTVYVQHKR